MIKMTAENVTLVMWSKRELPERTRVDGDWKPTGRIEEKTEYTLKDEWGNVLKLYGDNSYREFEGQNCEILAKISQRSFQGKQATRVRIEAILPAKAK